MIARKHFTLLGLAAAFVLASCQNIPQPDTKLTDSAARADKAPVVSQAGAKITFRDADSSRVVLQFAKAEFKDLKITTTAPARIILTTVKASGTAASTTVPVFETSDLTQLYTDYTKAKQDLLRTRHELERLRDLYQHNAIAGKDVTQAESEEVSAQATLAGLESRLLALALSPSELTKLSPDVSIMIANVPESEISSVQLGEDVQIEFDSWRGEIIHGRVLDIGHAVDPTSRTFNVRIEVPNRNKMLRPGMFARASFGIDVARRFVVPSAAVVAVQGKSFVFVTKDGKTFERREVQLGQQSGGDFIVLAGLADQETVVTNGAVLLKGLSFGS
jgi:multidrug efflux pump subunit AcrA (membrane-fusion protein)